jgi:hypothetical protein
MHSYTTLEGYEIPKKFSLYSKPQDFSSIQRKQLGAIDLGALSTVILTLHLASTSKCSYPSLIPEKFPIAIAQHRNFWTLVYTT